MEDAMYERLRRRIAQQRKPVPGARHIDFQYRPAWRPAGPDFLDRLLLS